MSRTRGWIGLAVVFVILAIGWNGTASATPGACKPVKACEAVKPLPILPACAPVKACERVDGYVKHETLHDRVALVLTAPKRLLAQHRAHHGRYVETSGVTPQGVSPIPAS